MLQCTSIHARHLVHPGLRSLQADVYSFAMICYELFEGSKPFGQMDAMSAARAASLFDRRPSWGKVNRRA